MKSIFSILVSFYFFFATTNGAPIAEKNSVARSSQVANKTLFPQTVQQQQIRKKRQGYYNLGNTDFKPSEFNDGISNQQLANPLSPAHQVGPNIFGDSSDPNQVAVGWIGQEFQGDVGQPGAEIVEHAHGNNHSPYLGNAVGAGNLGGVTQNNTNFTNGQNGNGNGYTNGNGNGYYNGNGYQNGNGGYNPFANNPPKQPGGQQTNYLQTNYGVQGNLYNPLLHSVYGYQFQQNQPYVSEQQNQFGKPQNQIENQQQVNKKVLVEIK